MQGIFSNLYLVLQSKLSAISGIRFVAEDTGQLFDDQPAVLFPCIFINIDNVQFSNIAENCQMGMVYVVLKLVCDVYSDSSGNTPLSSKEKGLNYLAIESQIHQVIQGYSPSSDAVPVVSPEAQPTGWADVFGAFDRVSAVTNKQRPDLRIRELTYSLGFEDYSTANIITYAPATLSFTDTIVITEL